MLDYITLSTEPGVFGGLPASGHSFGPAYNASSLMEMNQMFDFYDGGGLDMCFLGAAEVSPTGDVNVSRMSADRLTGPGGFIDISQSTRNICFMTPFTAKGLKIKPNNGEIEIETEGQKKKFVSSVYEKTFSGDEAVRRGQTVYYVTERAVFRRSGDHDVIELIEIAPGVDLQRDVLDQMEFAPAISPNLKTMDSRIYRDEKMNVASDFFGSLEDRCTYHDIDHTVYIDLFGITLNSEDDIDWFISSTRDILKAPVDAKGPIDVVRIWTRCRMHSRVPRGVSILSSLSSLCEYRSSITTVLILERALKNTTAKKSTNLRQKCTRQRDATPVRLSREPS
jgi:propionate CoA-transferase